MMIVKRAILLFVLLACSFGTALAHMGIDMSEFQGRRQSVMNAVSDAIVLLHSFSAPKSWSESGFHQDSNFYYLTGLENLHDAILVCPSASPTHRALATLSGSSITRVHTDCEGRERDRKSTRLNSSH